LIAKKITISVKKGAGVGPPPEFDRRSVYARLSASKTNTKLLTSAMNS